MSELVRYTFSIVTRSAVGGCSVVLSYFDEKTKTLVIAGCDQQLDQQFDVAHAVLLLC